MNYPIWDVSFGAGLLIAVVAILHVFVSHFAVGGGLFLVLTERRALRRNDPAMLDWLKRHTKFFVLVTVVFGAVSGVGIWFTIALISPMATSNLIHAYVWGWAIEWVFFFIEIAAALFYLYGWDKLPAKVHQWYGWIYFIAAFASMVIINGIITFMLTSGRWIENHAFWTGFFNPTYFPSLAVRAAIAVALAGIYALITASRQHDHALKARIVRWSAGWIVPALLVLPALVWWYISKIPVELWDSAMGPMPTGTLYALLSGILLAVTFVLAVLARVRPGRIHLAFSLIVALVALGAMGSFEFVREAVRKPYVIANYLYANSLYAAPMPGDGGFTVEHLDDVGVLQTAKWVDPRIRTTTDTVAQGRMVFHLECASCHTPNAYRGVRNYLALRQWSPARMTAMLGTLDFMHNGVMPPFAGTNAELAALASYLDSLQPAVAPTTAAIEGHTVFVRNCVMCHRQRRGDPLFARLPRDPAAADAALASLPDLFIRMPTLNLSPGERTALVQWINASRTSENR